MRNEPANEGVEGSAEANRGRPSTPPDSSIPEEPTAEETVGALPPAPPEEDFTTEPLGPPPERPPTPRYDPAPERERKRGQLAASLVAVLAVVLVGSPIALGFGANVDELKSLLEVLVPPIVALTGTAVGFYFGGHVPS